METLQYIKQVITKKCVKFASDYKTSIQTLEFGEIDEAFYDDESKELEITFTGFVTYEDSPEEKEKLGHIFTCCYKTPKGYISKKPLPIEFENYTKEGSFDVSLETITELLKFDSDAKRNTYDPFWHENEAKRRNAAGWSGVTKFLQPDVDSF
jgi:hypothetical protein